MQIRCHDIVLFVVALQPKLLKFVPSVEELETLREHTGTIEQFSRADCFMMEMGRIPRYLQRLQSLFFKKTFEDRIGEVGGTCMSGGDEGGWRGCAINTVSVTMACAGSSQRRGHHGQLS